MPSDHTPILTHPNLGRIRGIQVTQHLTEFHSLPYALIPQRFARSQPLNRYPGSDDSSRIYDATKIRPCSIQPLNSTQKDVDSNQLPTKDIIDGEQDQSEDCLRLTITVPTINLTEDEQAKLPVLIFLHGESKPLVFVSVNYRLGASGFFHSSEAPDLVPANNGLHDQIRAFEWVREHISGFGGDSDNVTAMGQSAGGESLSLHNISGIAAPLYNRSIALAGTPNFRPQARKLGIATNGSRSSEDIAKTMIDTPGDKIRDLNFVGAPCTSSEILPYDRPTMELSASGPQTTVKWLESQIVSAAGYDGSISWIITKNNPKRKDHARSFKAIAVDVLGQGLAVELCELYGINDRISDDDTLTEICQFESDMSFIRAAEAVAEAIRLTESVPRDAGTRQIFSTHTWDIVALLGAYDERLSEDYDSVVEECRSKIIGYCVTGQEPWSAVQDSEAMSVSKSGLNVVDVNSLPSSERKRELDRIASAAKGDSGHDLLWEGVYRRCLDQGE
ncbi:Cholinesterase [Fulvia fulva]|nr:Cholinesterase [Fulvia fulva]